MVDLQAFKNSKSGVFKELHEMCKNEDETNLQTIADSLNIEYQDLNSNQWKGTKCQILEHLIYDKLTCDLNKERIAIG